MHRIFAILILVMCSQLFSAQKSLEVTKVGWAGGLKISRIKNYDVLEYKLRGERKFRKDKLVNMQDSVLVFSDGNSIFLSDIRKLKIHSGNALVSVFHHLFIIGGVAFISLTTVNNLIVPTEPVISETAALISAGLVTTGLLIREMGIKRIKVNARVHLRIVNINFQDLNTR
ncbi:MAG: hypothetical protein PSX36_00465 [bacterium]|nr:hypothetical protein [bacterium]